MRLQKNTLLALYSAIEFAVEPARHISAAEIASRHGVSAHHLAKVLSELAHAGIVESVRGVGGGYRFAGNPRRLTLMDIIRLFEDFARPAAGATNAPRTRRDGASGDAPDIHSPQAVDRALDTVLSEIDDIARATFSSITLATMLRLVERHGAPASAAARTGGAVAAAASRAPPARQRPQRPRPRSRPAHQTPR